MSAAGAPEYPLSTSPYPFNDRILKKHHVDFSSKEVGDHMFSDKESLHTPGATAPEFLLAQPVEACVHPTVAGRPADACLSKKSCVTYLFRVT